MHPCTHAFIFLPLRLLVFFKERLPCRQADVGEVDERGRVGEKGRELKENVLMLMNGE